MTRSAAAEPDLRLMRGTDNDSRGGGVSTGTSDCHHRSDATTEAEWRDAAGRSCLRTGDIGRFERGGLLMLLDCRGHMTISGGLHMSPSDLEPLLVAHAAFAVSAEPPCSAIGAILQRELRAQYAAAMLSGR